MQTTQRKEINIGGLEAEQRRSQTCRNRLDMGESQGLSTTQCGTPNSISRTTSMIGIVVNLFNLYIISLHTL